MILHGEGKRIIAQAHLLDDVVGRAPSLDGKSLRDAINRLMMRAVYFFETMTGGTVVAQRLDILIFLLGEIVAFDVKLERAAERDIENLEALANRKNRQTTRENFCDGFELPAIPRKIDIFIQDG